MVARNDERWPDARAPRTGVRDAPPSLVLQRRGGWLLCRIRGPMTLAALQGWLGEVAACCRAPGVQAALVDLTDASDVVDAADQLRLGLRMGAAWPADVPVAVLVAPHGLLPERVFEHVASHGGVRIRSFSDARAAAAWLAAQWRPPPGPPSG